MDEHYHDEGLPDLSNLPSAKANGGVAISGRAAPPISAKKRSKSRWLFSLLFSVLGFGAVALIGLVLLISSGPISNDRIRSEIEQQLSSLLGEGHSARIADTKLALGRNGFIALDATDVTILKDGQINLGVAKEVAVKVKAVPLISGSVVAESVIMRGAKLSLAPFIGSQENVDWPTHINFSQSLQSMGQAISKIEKNLIDAGLDSISLDGADLVGFEQLGLRSANARVTQLRLERNVNFQDGLFITADLKTDQSTWHLEGSWKESGNGGKTLNAVLSGLDISDFLGEGVVSARGQMKMRVVAPFAADGAAQQVIVNVAIDRADLELKEEQFAYLPFAAFNFRILTEKNQIELERSPLRFETTQTVLLGGIRFPKSDAEAVNSKPIFQIIANDVTPYGLEIEKDASTASVNLEGWLNAAAKDIEVTNLQLNTPSGRVEGSATFDLSADRPHYKADLKIPDMKVADFKRFWPAFLAKGARKWANEGVRDGRIKNAVLNIDMPPGLFGNPTEYAPEHLSAKVPLFGSSIKTIGGLPRLNSANAVVNFGGSRTNVELSSGKLDLGKRGIIDVGSSTLDIGSFTDKALPSSLKLRIGGKAQGMAALGAIQPFNFSKNLNIDPADLSGNVNADVTASMNLRDVARQGVRDWRAQVTLKNAASRKPFQGRKVENAQLAISASPQRIEVKGTAVLDGVPAKLALAQKPGSKGLEESRVVLTVSDRMRSKIIGDTGKIIQGPIDVILTSSGKGNRIEADLKKARLNFPWIGWSKGKGIAAKATFVVTQKNGVQVLENFKLKGNGFSAAGRMELDKSGLRKANLSRIRLNKTDDFDVAVLRTKNGFSISLNARAYDGRALIKTFLNSDRAGAKGGVTVRVVGTVDRLFGFGGESLRKVKLDFSQRGSQVRKAVVDAQTGGGATTRFSMKPVQGGLNTTIAANDAGALLRFLDLYGKIRGGRLQVNLVQDSEGVFRGPVRADDFVLINEPRLAKLLAKPVAPVSLRNGAAIVRELKKVNSNNVQVDSMQADIIKGPGFLSLKRGRLSGGDASAAFDGLVYDRKNRMKIKGTYLPARSLNRLVSKIPILGLAFGKGKVKGLLGITFKLSGRFDKPKIQVNPLSILAPGVFREIFKF